MRRRAKRDQATAGTALRLGLADQPDVSRSRIFLASASISNGWVTTVIHFTGWPLPITAFSA